MALTSVDPPELLRFIRRQYPAVELRPPEKSIYRLIREKGFLPSPRARYCCAVLKEQHGKGTVTLLGIRGDESARRAARKEMTAGYREIAIDQFNNDKEKMITCIGGRDKILLSPVLN